MKIGLASYRCENRDMQFNIRQIERAMKETRGKPTCSASGRLSCRALTRCAGIMKKTGIWQWSSLQRPSCICEN